MTSLLVGHGLLGAAVARRLSCAGRHVVRVAVPWDDTDAAVRALVEAAETCEVAGRQIGAGWDLYWCAGAGVVATPESALRREVELAERFVSEVRQPPRAVFLASSAGGVYAGSATAPFTEAHEPRPLAPYGHAKLDVEACFATLTRRGSRVVVARIANLYGPGQDLSKPQGLVSQLCLSHFTGRPLRLYVPGDTLRDYLFVEDAAAVAVAMTNRIAAQAPGSSRTKILASGHSVSVSGLVAAVSRALRRRPPVVRAAATGARQVRDLRLRSTVWTDLDGLVRTPLVVGLHATLEDIAQQQRAAHLPAR